MLLRYLILFSTFVLISTNLFAVVQNETVNQVDDSLLYYDWVIDSIVINNQNIFDTDNEKYDKFIYKLPNKFHIKTKKFIVRKEILFDQGDRVDFDLISETERNLRNNLNIYDAKIKIVPKDSGHVKIVITTWDQWSLTGGVTYNREGNETNTKIGLLEKNLLGLNQYLLFDYIFQSDDDNYFNFIFLSKRIKSVYNFKLNINTDPKFTVYGFSIQRPFYQINDNQAYHVEPIFFEGRNDYYLDDALLGSSEFKGETFSAKYQFRRGEKRLRFNGEIGYRYNYSISENRKILSTNPHDSLFVLNRIPSDSVSHSLTIGGGLIQNNFIKMNKVNALFYTEDFRVGHSFYATFKRAFTPDLSSYHFDKFMLSLEHNFAFDRNLVFISFGYSYWYHNSSKLGNSGSFRLNYLGKYSSLFSIAVQSRYYNLNDNRYPDQLSLNGVSDIRGYDKYYKTGSKEFVTNVELRFFTDLEILTALFGGVIFTDFGNIWKKSEPVKFKDFSHSVGVGLRVGFSRSTKKVIRIDLAYTDQKIWELSVATGQFFEISSIF